MTREAAPRRSRRLGRPLHLVDPALLRLEALLYSDRPGVSLRAALEVVDRSGLATTKYTKQDVRTDVTGRLTSTARSRSSFER